MSTLQNPAQSPSSDTKQLQFTDDQFIWKFSPNQTDQRLLEAIFVGREKLLQDVVEKVLESANTRSRHHVLLYGPRGIGKSHFISLLNYRLNQNQAIQDRLRIARLHEDETTTDFTQLLARIYRSLSKAYPEEFPASWLHHALYQPATEMQGLLERRLVSSFTDRTLVILIENLDMLLKNFGKTGQHALRSFLQTHAIACLVATSQQLSKAMIDRNEPFFGFFQNIPLKPLTIEEAGQLLQNIAKSKQQYELVAFLNTPEARGRVRAIHNISGGNHRVFIVLSGFITRDSLDELVGPFQKMADELTPYYQERLRSISPQQRQIIELLCQSHQTLTPSTMAHQLMAIENTVSGQLNKLIKIGYVNSIRRGRETFYDLTEPLMRLAFEVKEESLLTMLVDFLRCWYRPDQMQKLRGEIKSAETLKYLDAAISRSATEPDLRIKVLEDAIAEATEESDSHAIGDLLEDKAAATNQTEDWVAAGRFYFNKEEWQSAIECFDKAIKIDETWYFAWCLKGIVFCKINRYEDAIKCFDKAIEIDENDCQAWELKFLTQFNCSRYEDALETYEKEFVVIKEVAYYEFYTGTVLSKLGRHEDAIKYFDKALTLDPNDDYAANNKGDALYNLGLYEDALEIFDNLIKSNPQFSWPHFNRAEALFALLRWDEGLKQIRRAFAESDTSENCGDVAALLGLIFQKCESDEQIHSRISRLVDLYEQAAADEARNARKSKTGRAPENPLSWFGDGLVKSLGKINATRITPMVMNGFVAAIEVRMGKIPQMEVPLRLFRYGIRYLISGDEGVFVELIQTERLILRQALRLNT